MKIRPLPPIFSLCAVLLAFSAVARADKASDAWTASEPIRKQVGELRKTDSKAAAELLKQTLKQVTDPNVAADFYTTLSLVYINDLKQPDEAIKLLDFALPLFKKPENKVPAYAWIGLVGAKAKALLVLKKPTESEALLRENMPLLLECGRLPATYYPQTSVGLALRSYLDVLKAQGGEREKEIPGLLGTFLSNAPLYLKLERYENAGWIYDELITSLQKQKKHAEALTWGKLRYQLCAYDKTEIETVTRALVKSWAAMDDFGAVGAFNKAQTDGAEENPLSRIPLPPLTTGAKEFLRNYVVELETKAVKGFNPKLAYQIISLHIMLGTPDDLAQAMQIGERTLREHAEVQDGSLQICRVFKATDFNLIRANAFLAFLNGEGKNPIPAFLEEMKAKKTGAKPAGA
jgi:tetratricopeptide (TPR) repeat protein